MENQTATPTTAENLESVVMSGLESTSSDEGTQDLMNDFVSSLTQDLPVQDPTNPQGTTEPAEDLQTPDPNSKTPVTDEEIPELPKNASPKARESWDKLRSRGDTYKAEVESKVKELEAREERIRTMEAELTELKAKAAKVPEYEDRLKDLDEYEKELKMTRIEATREYREAITEPFKALSGAVQTLIDANGGNDADEIFSMIQEVDPGKQRSTFKDLTAGWDDVDRNELWSAVKDARMLYDKQSSMKQNAAAAAKERESVAAQRAVQEKEAAIKTFQSAAADVVKDMRGHIPFVPLVEGETEDDRYTRLVEKLNRVDFESQTPRGKALAAAAALEYSNLIKVISRLQDENKKLTARVTKTNATTPAMSPRAAATASNEDNLFDFEEPAARLSHSIHVTSED